MNALVYLNQLVAGCLLGAQLVWTLAVIPTYRHLSPAEYLKAHTILTWYGDALMPGLGVGTTILCFLRYRETGHWSALVGALALSAAGIAASRNLGINNRLRAVRAGDLTGWSGEVRPDRSPEAVVADRKRWAWQHFLRNGGGFVAFATALVVPSGAITLGRPAGLSVGWIDAVMVVVAVMAGRELVGHVLMMRGRGPSAHVGAELGLRNTGTTEAMGTTATAGA
jgi:hypothetical protein